MISFLDVNPRDKVICDSGKNYNIGYFIREADDILKNTVIIYLITGERLGVSLRTKDSIILYSDENVSKMYKKYKYYIHYTELKIRDCTLQKN